VSTFGGFPRADAVAVDPASGNVYVTDVNGHALAKFAPDGTPLGTFTTAGSPVGVAVDPSTGDVYATVYETSEVQKFSANGTLLQTIGGPGSGAGMFNHPFGVAVDASNGDVYVGDAGNGVQRFTSRGVFLDQTPTGLAALALAVDPGTGVVYAGFGNGSVWLLGILPAISGSPTDGATVYASRASQVGRGPFTYSYQWLDCPPGGGACVNNGPPTSSNGLRLKPGDEGQTIEVAVTQTGAAGTVGPHTSAPIGPVLPSPPVNTVAPVISGSSADGSVLSATHGTWSGAPATSYSYVWQSCGGTCANVATNAAGYRLQPSDVGHTIKVLVAETNPDGTGGPVASSAVGPITASPPVNASPPTITGPYASGSRLTGQAGTWTGVLPITYAYQWQRCPDGTAATCTDIPGATLGSYVLTPADTHVRLVVKATNADGGPVTATSAIAG
jgi:hypothetical protein